MRAPLPFAKCHLDEAHRAWRAHLRPGDCAIDATCGNGRDLVALVDCVQPRCSKDEKGLFPQSPRVFAYDIQPQALKSAQDHCRQSLHSQQLPCIEWMLCCHSHLGLREEHHPIALICYNLGYLPGGDKTLTTRLETTMNSLEKGKNLLSAGGAISIMCYPGHDEGDREWNAVRDWALRLSVNLWCVCEHRWLNRLRSPVWFWLQKAARQPH